MMKIPENLNVLVFAVSSSKWLLCLANIASDSFF